MSIIDRFLISHCSPTLASLKTASLFNYTFSTYDELEQCLAGNIQLNGKGVFLEVLHAQDSQALILVYRKSKFKEDLQKSGVAEFLFTYGYQNNSVEYCIRHIKHRFELRKEFPHEIGIFLGYPLEDVIGFIKNGGQNSKCTGCWKVYGNECEAMKLFAKYKKCRNIYQKLFFCGRSVLQLTVTA
ncbi:MAG TPA: DUF3793 family protein [Desulfitobacteriaceae bacterium]|nr:DUF3793 family protein [Desulfitobacteriaceae bacterium]